MVNAKYPFGRCSGFLNEPGVCTAFSAVYDVALNIVWGMMLVYWAYGTPSSA